MSAQKDKLSYLRAGAATFDIILTNDQLEQFRRYKALIVDWNQRMNLTAITGDEGIEIRHFLDSLSCTSATGSLNHQKLVDVGAGAGFPGLPLKFLFPYMQLTLIESVRKKSGFLEAVVKDLNLEDVEVINDRVEKVGQDPKYRAAFDWAVARGVAKLDVLVEYLLPLCRIGGRVLAQKGPGAVESASRAADAISLLGGGEVRILSISLPGQKTERNLVVIPKENLTPDKYPRRTGIPAKRPLS